MPAAGVLVRSLGVDGMADSSPVVVVTGANGLMGAPVCRALVEQSPQVRAVLCSATALHGITEHSATSPTSPSPAR
jgi:NAD(P)-dependent dehydrogenase (short-subunit alcohol dehydrogenase family)